MILDTRIEDGFYVVVNERYWPVALALISRSYEDYGDLMLVFSGEADVEEYMVSWGFDKGGELGPRFLQHPGQIESLCEAAKIAGVQGMAINPPLDERPPQTVLSLEEVQEWARSKED